MTKLQLEYHFEADTAIRDRDDRMQDLWHELESLKGVTVSSPPPEPGQLGALSDAVVVAAVGSPVIAELVRTVAAQVRRRVVKSATFVTFDKHGTVRNRWDLTGYSSKEIERIATRLKDD